MRLWVRVIAFDHDGLVLRWVVDVSQEASSVLGGYHHGHLEPCEGRDTAREGWRRWLACTVAVG